MGICFWDAKMLLEARSRGVSFERTLTIGHQSLFLHPRERAELERELASRVPGIDLSSFKGYQFGDFADAYLSTFLNAGSVSVMDFSEYEGADLIHDLNQPVPPELHESFDAVIDSGTLEHVFNFPVAIASLMQMVKVGGSIFLAHPANNLCGHGFYQFSPELMFRVFTEANGFDLRRVIIFESRYPSIEMTPCGDAYEVTDPEQVRERVQLRSDTPLTMLVEAKRTAAVPIFATPPLQSDYVTMWSQQDADISRVSLKKRIRKLMPEALAVRISGTLLNRRFSFANKRHFKKIN